MNKLQTAHKGQSVTRGPGANRRGRLQNHTQRLTPAMLKGAPAVTAKVSYTCLPRRSDAFFLDRDRITCKYNRTR